MDEAILPFSRARATSGMGMRSTTGSTELVKGVNCKALSAERPFIEGRVFVCEEWVGLGGGLTCTTGGGRDAIVTAQNLPSPAAEVSPSCEVVTVQGRAVKQSVILW